MPAWVSQSCSGETFSHCAKTMCSAGTEQELLGGGELPSVWDSHRLLIRTGLETAALSL